jgi:hypothetical protein
LREQTLSLVTLGMLAKRRRRFLMMYIEQILSQHAVSICCAGQLGGAHTIFLMNSICCAAIMLPMRGMS